MNKKVSQKNKQNTYFVNGSRPAFIGMKVIMLSGDSKIYDESSSVFKRAQGYANHLDELIVVVPVRERNLSVKKVGSLRIIPVTISSKIFGFFTLLKKLKKVAKENMGKCIITAQDPFYYGLISSFVARKFNIPLEVQVHTDVVGFTKGKNFLRAISRYSLLKADRVRVVSESAFNQLKKEVVNISEKSYILPIAVSEGEYEEVLFKKTKPSILVVSRLEEEKNISRALKIFRKLRERIPDVELRIAGEGSLEHRLRKESVTLGIEAHTVFLGFLGDLSDEYARAGILLHSSNYEGFGLVFVEAAQRGLPIVSTDTGIASDITDYVYEGDNIERAADFSQKLLTDEREWERASERVRKSSRKFIVSQRTYQKNITDAWVELFNRDSLK